MRTLCASVMLALLVVGCNKKSEPGGLVGVDRSNNSQTFKVTAPAMPTTLKQGETETVKIKLDRGREFKQDVEVTMQAPEGIKVEPATKDIKASENAEAEFKITADAKAAIGDHTVKVIAKPDTGSSTSVEFKVKVSAAS